MLFDLFQLETHGSTTEDFSRPNPQNPKCFHVFRGVFVFGKFVNVIESIIICKQKNLRAMSSSHLHLVCKTRLHCVCLFGILLTQHIHALDQFANFVFIVFLTIFYRKLDVYESSNCFLECALLMSWCLRFSNFLLLV